MYKRDKHYLLLDRNTESKNDIVYFPRAQIGDILKAKAEEAGRKIGPVPPTKTVDVFRYGFEPSKMDSLQNKQAKKKDLVHITDPPPQLPPIPVQVVTPRSLTDWISLARLPVDVDRSYQIGRWVVRQEEVIDQNGRGGEFYFNAYGSVDPQRRIGGGIFNERTGLEALQNDYGALAVHIEESWEKAHHRTKPRDFQITELTRRMLRGGDASAAPASLATVVACYFLAEPRRWEGAFPIGLMILDLIDNHLMTWPETLSGGHPIGRSKGRGNDPNNLPTETLERGTDVVMEWLESTSQPQRDNETFASDDTKCGEPADAEAVKLVSDRIEARLSTFEGARQSQHIADTLARHGTGGEPGAGSAPGESTPGAGGGPDKGGPSGRA